MLGCLLVLLLAACGGWDPISFSPSTATPAATGTPAQVSTPLPPTPRVDPTERALTLSPTPTPGASPPDTWQTLPVIPTQVSPRVGEIYRSGLAMGNQAHIFSRIGDCASTAPEFLVGFGQNYNLGAYASLQPAIDYFQGSFGRPSLAAKAGLNTAGLLTTLWTDPQCGKNETLLDCQYRLDKPSLAFIALGTNEAYYVHHDASSFEHNLRIILDDTIAKGIVPILATKADNVEGDNSINATIARLAEEYQLPLWNFWLAAQPLPDHGLVDPEHLTTVSYNNFTDFSLPNSLQYGMQVRNLTALQMLDLLRQQLAATR